jgi:DNA-binding NtrC family response regulator
VSYLTVREGGIRQVYRLAGVFAVGRGRSCDAVLTDPLSSKRHLEIEQAGSRFMLRDLNSTNGTRIGGKPISGEVALQDGDEITVGSACLLFTRNAPSIISESVMRDAAPQTGIRSAGLVASIDANQKVPEVTLSVPLERFGLHAPDFCSPTPQATPESAADFGIWLRSLYSLLREGNTCENEDDLLSSADRILSEALPAARVRFLFETAPSQPKDSTIVAAKEPQKELAASGFIVWHHPVRGRGHTSRILDLRLSGARIRLLTYARGQCEAVLSRDIGADERPADGSPPASKASEKVSMMVCPLISGRTILGYLAVERAYRPQVMGKGATKPFAQPHLEFAAAAAYPLGTLLANIRRRQSVMTQFDRLRKSVADSYEIVGNSPPIRAVLSIVEKVAPADSPVLVLGESGTGKELVARAIHTLSQRRDGPFEAINCGALPQNLIESELFGHARGAFTGAIAHRAGCFESASRGTLFLDEIGELPLNAQTRLLRVLEENKVARVGESRLREIDCRIVAATNRDLAAEVKAGHFREDLYYRLRVMDVTLPPLRERLEDMQALAEHLLKPMGAFRLSPDLLKMFKCYRWPGNVRELHNTLERMAVMSRPPAGEARSGVTALTVDDVPLDIRRAVEIGSLLKDGTEAGDSGRANAAGKQAGDEEKASENAFNISAPQIRSLEQLQVEYARWVLKHFKGNKSKAAKALGIQRSTLYSWTEWADPSAD